MKCSVKDCNQEPYTLHVAEGIEYPMCKKHNEEYMCFLIQNRMLNNEIVKNVIKRERDA